MLLLEFRRKAGAADSQMRRLVKIIGTVQGCIPSSEYALERHTELGVVDGQPGIRIFCGRQGFCKRIKIIAEDRVFIITDFVDYDAGEVQTP